jgi:carboxymethylenebutenolidase
MTHQQIDITTADGTCPAHFFTPEGDGPWPAAIIYMDIFGMRPATIAFAARLASYGYAVLLPDIFYRRGAYAPLEPAKAFAGDFRTYVAEMFAATDKARATADSAYFLETLAARPEVKHGKVGVTGYCFGGGIALTVAGTYPDRIGAAASFHGGNLATDDEDSPHRLLPNVQAEVYIGVADNDHSYPPEMGARMVAALDDAGLTYQHELYPGAGHGWTQTDFPIYDQDADDRHWRELVALFKRTIG